MDHSAHNAGPHMRNWTLPSTARPASQNKAWRA